jgi:hypothetical protein
MGARLQSRRVQITVVCMLGGAIAYNVLHFTGKKPRSRNLVYHEAGIEAGLAQAVAPNWSTGEYRSAASWGRHPFTGSHMMHPAPGGPPAGAEVAAEPGPKTIPPGAVITGVVIAGESRYVLAGDLLLREGDRLGGGRIKTINRDSVVVEYETGTKTVYIQ